MKKLLAILTTILCTVLYTPTANAQAGVFVRPNASTLTSPITNSTWYFNQTDGHLYSFNGVAFVQIDPLQVNLVATTDPGASNDSTEGYQVGSVWLNTSNGNTWFCADNTASAAIWNLFASNNLSIAQLPFQLVTSMALQDFATSAILPSPASGLTLTLPAGQAYVNGQYFSIATSSYTYTDNSWTYDFVTNTGIIAHYNVMTGASAPSVSNAVLAYRVVASGGNITTVVPFFAVPNALRSYMITPPNSANKVFQTDPTNPLGVKYDTFPIAGLSPGSAANYNALIFNGSIWTPAFLPLLSLDTSTASTGNTIQFDGTYWLAQTLSPAGGGTGNGTAPTDGQVLVGSTSSGLYAPATISNGTNITVTGGANTLSIGLFGQVAPANGGTGNATVPSNGQIPIGDGTIYTPETITPGTGIGINNAAHSITISNIGLPPNSESSDFNAAGGNSYFCTGSLTATLPDATACGGQEIIVWNTGSGTVTYAVTSAQTINGSAATFTSSTQWEMYRFISDGANWEMTKATGPTS
jgi:hypothetical protein